MTTPAERQARRLIQDHGAVEARRLVREALARESNVNERNYWIAVLEALR